MPVKPSRRRERKERIRRPVTIKAASPQEEREFLLRSRRALENLQRNIGELKSELRKSD
jgi:hypothetical protein